MLMMSASNLAQSYGARKLYSNVNLKLRSGEVTALIGPNGCGKSTLLRSLAGELEADQGSIWRRPGACVAYLPQNAADVDSGTPLSLCLRAMEPLGSARVHDATTYLSRLGIHPLVAETDMGKLSAGQRTWVGIACAFASQPEILLLDEPTNHLDSDSIDALISLLKSRRRAVLMVSHDRNLLDAVADCTAQLSENGLRTFAGNYSAFRAHVARERDAALKLYKHQENEERRLEIAARRQMEWFKQAHRAAGTDDFARARAKKGAARALASSTRLERLRESRIPKPAERNEMSLNLGDASRCGRRIIIADGISAVYDRKLFADANLSVMRGDRLGIIGRNGCGKTTLLKMLAGEVKPHSGSVWISPSASVFYFQQNLEHIDSSARVFDSVLEAGAGSREKAMALLASLLLTAQASVSVRNLSFGERVRLAFAHMMAAHYDVLILDEPTNNLDIDSREAIEACLEAWRGTLIAVSHDRYFISRLCSRLLEFAHDGLRIVEGRTDAHTPMIADNDELLVQHRIAVISAQLADPVLSEEQKLALTEELIALSRNQPRR